MFWGEKMRKGLRDKYDQMNNILRTSSSSSARRRNSSAGLRTLGSRVLVGMSGNAERGR